MFPPLAHFCAFRSVKRERAEAGARLCLHRSAKPVTGPTAPEAGPSCILEDADVHPTAVPVIALARFESRKAAGPATSRGSMARTIGWKSGSDRSNSSRPPSISECGTLSKRMGRLAHRVDCRISLSEQVDDAAKKVGPGVGNWDDACAQRRARTRPKERRRQCSIAPRHPAPLVVVISRAVCHHALHQ